jgi:hypothetical protein
MHRPQWHLGNRAAIQTTTSPQTFRNSSNNSSAANISIVENIISSLQKNQSTNLIINQSPNLIKDPTPMTHRRSSFQHHRLLTSQNSSFSNGILSSSSSSNMQSSTYFSRELVTPPADFNIAHWNQTSEENRKSVLDFIRNESPIIQQINLMNSVNIDSDETHAENYLENQSDINIQDSQYISANHNLGMHMENHAADLSPNTVTLSMLLNDPNIISDDIFQPIHKYLVKLKKKVNERDKFISKIDIPLNCPICLQDFQKLLIHQRYASAPYGCYNMARVREYICLKKGIPFQRSTTSAVTLYTDFNSLESTILDLN